MLPYNVISKGTGREYEYKITHVNNTILHKKDTRYEKKKSKLIGYVIYKQGTTQFPLYGESNGVSRDGLVYGSQEWVRSIYKVQGLHKTTSVHILRSVWLRRWWEGKRSQQPCSSPCTQSTASRFSLDMKLFACDSRTESVEREM